MVATTLSRGTDPSIPASRRIVAMSGAMALHVVVFGVLLMPIALPIVQDPPARPKPPPTELVDIEPARPPQTRPVPAIPMPPRTARRVEPQPVAEPVAEPVEPVETLSRIVEPAATAAPPIEVALAAQAPPIAPRGPAETGSVEYVYAPPPAYPPAARRKGWSGVVVLRVLIDEQGLPARIEVARSSGRALLDVTAAKQVRKWRFRPALSDGVAVRAWAQVPVDFQLHRF
jgi:protein TonB